MTSPDPAPTNRLADEASAYLRQHMRNPVDWYPWGDEALARAQKEEKPLLVSIGYSACHWCHVMERESFEDAETAALMNDRFVCIKVDREERPDVDQIYMDAVVRMQGQGGWPLTIFCTPTGRPFYGGTYYPPEPRHGLPSFRQVLQAMDRAWHEQRDEVDESARRILRALDERPRGVAQGLPGTAVLAAGARKLMESADRHHGGFGSGPKFPTPTNLDTLWLALDVLEPDECDALRGFLRLTYDRMCRRGLYDPLGGGFHRYCVDGHWGVPHFEKMLYDQGQLLRSYAEAWRRSGQDDADLVWPIAETAEYLAREMTAPDGAFHASQDADSEGVEGRFYVWTPAQLEAVLGPERAAAFATRHGVTEEGNFEGANVLRDGTGDTRDAYAEDRAALLAARGERVWPARDDKIVAGWNGLTIAGLATAGSLLDRPAWIRQAEAAADFVFDAMRDAEGRQLRVHARGRAKLPAFLDDFAALLQGSLDLHRATGAPTALARAVRAADEIASRFFDADENDLFLTPSDGEALVHRPRSDHDGAMPHSSGLAVIGLLRVASLAGREDLRRIAERVLRTHAFVLERAPHAFPTLVRAAYWAERGLGVAVVVGDPADERRAALALAARRALAPDEAVLVVSEAEPPEGVDPGWLAGRGTSAGRATAYVCRGTVCSLPVTEPGALASAVPASAQGAPT